MSINLLIRFFPHFILLVSCLALPLMLFMSVQHSVHLLSVHAIKLRRPPCSSIIQPGACQAQAMWEEVRKWRGGKLCYKKKIDEHLLQFAWQSFNSIMSSQESLKMSSSIILFSIFLNYWAESICLALGKLLLHIVSVSQSFSVFHVTSFLFIRCLHFLSEWGRIFTHIKVFEKMSSV